MSVGTLGYTEDPILRRFPKTGVYFTLVTRVGQDQYSALMACTAVQNYCPLRGKS